MSYTIVCQCCMQPLYDVHGFNIVTVGCSWCASCYADRDTHDTSTNAWIRPVRELCRTPAVGSGILFGWHFEASSDSAKLDAHRSAKP